MPAKRSTISWPTCWRSVSRSTGARGSARRPAAGARVVAPARAVRRRRRGRADDDADHERRERAEQQVAAAAGDRRAAVGHGAEQSRRRCERRVLAGGLPVAGSARWMRTRARPAVKRRAYGTSGRAGVHAPRARPRRRRGGRSPARRSRPGEGALRTCSARSVCENAKSSTQPAVARDRLRPDARPRGLGVAGLELGHVARGRARQRRGREAWRSSVTPVRHQRRAIRQVPGQRSVSSEAGRARPRGREQRGRPDQHVAADVAREVDAEERQPRVGHRVDEPANQLARGAARAAGRRRGTGRSADRAPRRPGRASRSDHAPAQNTAKRPRARRASGAARSAASPASTALDGLDRRRPRRSRRPPRARRRRAPARPRRSRRSPSPASAARRSRLRAARSRAALPRRAGAGPALRWPRRAAAARRAPPARRRRARRSACRSARTASPRASQ